MLDVQGLKAKPWCKPIPIGKSSTSQTYRWIRQH